MLTLDELKKKKPVFLDQFDSAKKVFFEFEGVWDDEKEGKRVIRMHKGENILFAYYSYENYSGTAYVLFEKDGKLFEVFGSHCSCYGLERQWKPDEVNLETIKKLLVDRPRFYAYDDFEAELALFLSEPK